MNKEIFDKIILKKEFSQIPAKDVEVAFKQFDKEHFTDEEKIKKTRDLLRKVFSVFTSSKLLKLKNKNYEWVLKKHISTRERFENYSQIYKRVFSGVKDKKISVVDLGAGVNGFSYLFLKQAGFDIEYLGVEAIGQLVSLMNDFFKKENLNAKAIHLSLFELEKISNILNEIKKPRVVFLFKVIDSLEMLERDYSKKLLKEISIKCERIVISFATRSLIKRKRFFVKRYWLETFLNENFEKLDDFEINGEKYIVLEKKK